MNFRKYIAISIIWLCSNAFISGQSIGIPLNSDSYQLLDRWDIIYPNLNPLFSELKYHNRRDAVRFALLIDTLDDNPDEKTRMQVQYILDDNNEWLKEPDSPTTLTGKNESALKKIYTDSLKQFYYLEANASFASLNSDKYTTNSKPILKYFYRTPANFFELDTKGFYAKINPIFDFNYGKDSKESRLLLSNTRGFELRGGIDDRVYFYTALFENQMSVPGYLESFINERKSIPSNGYYKNFSSTVLKKWVGYDFSNAQAYIGFNATKHIGVQFGYGNQFIGDGYRSMFLSDFSNNYLYLKLNTRIGKFHYQNIFGELSAFGSRDGNGDDLLPKKYFACHQLSVKIRPNLTIGAYEAIVFSRPNRFEFHYLNPVIFYRTAEIGLGSKDNALLGIYGKWNFLHKFSLYTQFLLDEFKFNELITNNKGWWANKYGMQLGMKYVNAFGIKQLDLLAEYNMARPYTYSHNDSIGSFTHYNQPLAHPLGSNFREFIFNLNYPIAPKIVLEMTFIHANQGENEPGKNWGAYPLIPNAFERVSDYGNQIGQGINTKINQARVAISYQFYHNMYFDLSYYNRSKSSSLLARDQSNSIVYVGVRVNTARRKLIF